MKKRGRRQKPHVCTWDRTTVDGLYHCPDGRWRVVATGERFTEPDERLAVARFRQMEASRLGHNAFLPAPIPAFDSDPDLAGAVDYTIRHELGHGEYHAATAHESFVLKIPLSFAEPMTLLRAIPVEFLAKYFRDELTIRPQFWANLTGIEQLGYLYDLPKPTPSPTLKEVGQYFFDKKKISKDWMQKCKAFWAEFVEFMAVEKLREITIEKMVDYADAIVDAPFEGTYSRQRFQAIKSIINYARRRGKWPEDCTKVYAFSSVLVPNKKSQPKPEPIAPEDFRKLHDAADVQMRAILLVMLNFCMYGGEAARLDWIDIDPKAHTLLTHRLKTNEIVRIGVAWPRTVEALDALPRKTDAIFLNDIGGRHQYLTIYRAFTKLRAAAGLPKVNLSQIRDGAYTNAIRAGIAYHFVMMLAGHETGQPDRYVERQPQMVADACRAIEKHYFG